MKLERFAYTEYGVFGTLTIGTDSFCTIERPWLFNLPSKSCIPEGTYELQLGKYNRGGYSAYEVMNVPGRSDIKIHIANTMDDVLGCIGVANKLGYIKGKWAVSDSRNGFNRFMLACNNSPEETNSITIYQYRPK